MLGLSPGSELTDSTSISVMFQKAFQKCTSRFCMMRSNSAPRNSGSMANRPPVKRELAATPGDEGGVVKEPWWQPDCSVRLGKRGTGEGVGRVQLPLTEARLVAFVVFPEGHQPDGESLQERPDGRCEL